MPGTSGAARRAGLVVAASVVMALTVSACSTDEGNLNGTMKGGRGTTGSSPSAPSAPPTAPVSPAPSASSTAHGEADLAFALAMLRHHLQAEELAGLVATRSDDAGLQALATSIATAQHTQVEQLTALLGAWKASPNGSNPGPVAGMVSDAELEALGRLGGAAFRTEWLQTMIAHHEGALALARTELASGTSPQARALATSIVASHQAEIDRMKALQRLPVA